MGVPSMSVCMSERVSCHVQHTSGIFELELEFILHLSDIQMILTELEQRCSAARMKLRLLRCPPWQHLKMEDQSRQPPLDSCCFWATPPPLPLLACNVDWLEHKTFQSAWCAECHPSCSRCKCIPLWVFLLYQSYNGPKSADGNKKQMLKQQNNWQITKSYFML